MMGTEAQARAKKRYRERLKSSGGFKRIVLDFYPSEIEVYEHIRSHSPMAAYIKELVIKDMGGGYR